MKLDCYVYCCVAGITGFGFEMVMEMEMNNLIALSALDFYKILGHDEYNTKY